MVHSEEATHVVFIEEFDGNVAAAASPAAGVACGAERDDRGGCSAAPSAASAAVDTSVAGTIRYANDAAPIADATVEFFDASGEGLVPVLSVTTDATGAYNTEGLEPGTIGFGRARIPRCTCRCGLSSETFESASDLTLTDGTHLTSSTCT